MIVPLIKPIWQILSKPYSIVMAFIFSYCLYAIMNETYYILIELLYKIFVLEEYSEYNGIATVVYFISNYWTTLIFLFSLIILSLTIGTITAFSYTYYIKKGSVIEAIFYSFNRIVDAFLYSFLFTIVNIIFLTSSAVVFLLAMENISIIALFSVVLIFIILLWIYINYNFIPVPFVMASREIKIKEALLNSFKTSLDKKINLLLVLIILFLFFIIYSSLTTPILLAIENEILFVFSFTFLFSIFLAYSSSAIANLYLP